MSDGRADVAYGVFRRAGEAPRIGARAGDRVLDLATLAGAGELDGLGGAFAEPSLNAFMASGRAAWAGTRGRVLELLAGGGAGHAPALAGALVAAGEAELLLPFEVADYVDFYSSLEHATNLGRLFRPGSEPLLPNWRHMPVGYHGRAGTVVVSGTPVRRPHGQSKAPDAPAPVHGPSARLDIELELGAVIGLPSRLGEPVPVDRALDHVFGLVLVNDWSARDLQAWEYQPLGPFLGKSFATSLAPWVVPLDALEPFRVPSADQDPEPPAYLRSEPWAFDIALEVGLRSAGMAADGREPDVVARTNARHLYWNLAQQIAHLTVNGASLRTGDLLASGTISGPDADSRGSLIELTWNGAEPLELSDGTTRTFLEDGDEVVLRGVAGGGSSREVGLGEVRGRIVP